MKTGIVFEGGAFRTIFSCGVMDAFLENNIMPDYMIGVSAGAAYGVSYASRQHRRNLDIILKYCNDKRYMGFNNLLHRNNKSYYGLEFTFETIPNELEPFDYDAFDQYPGEFYTVVTNVDTGKPEYIKYTTEDRTNQLLKATCALPLLFPLEYVNGTPYLDGGLSDSIPFEHAFESGCDRVIVVLTREEGYRKKTSSSTKTLARAYMRHPEIAKDLVKRAGRYNHTLKKLEKYEKEGKVMIIRPESTVGFSRLERNKDKIRNLYNDGYIKGLKNADKVKDFLAGK